MTHHFTARTYNNPSLGPTMFPNSFSVGGVHYRNNERKASCAICEAICADNPRTTSCLRKCYKLGYCP